MTILNFVVCDLCGVKVRPPENAGWCRAVKIAHDGMSGEDILADLCGECTKDFRRWFQGMQVAKRANGGATQ